MALTVYEAIDSRPLQLQSGEWTASRTFHVWDDAAPIANTIACYALLGTGGLPIYGDQFPDAVAPLIATSPDIRRREGHTDTYVVTWTYTQAPISPLQAKEPNDVGYVEFSADVRGEFVDAWRAISPTTMATLVGGTYANGTPATSFDDDIGGTAIDVAGEPKSVLVRQAEVEFGVTQEDVPSLGWQAAFVGRRNNVEFNGAAVGKVLFLGASVNRIAARKYRIGYRFLVDEWYHMRQAPFVNPDGSVALGAYVNNGIHAGGVYFVQPYPDFANFYALSPYFTGVV